MLPEVWGWEQGEAEENIRTRERGSEQMASLELTNWELNNLFFQKYY
jgi:hypothetical protein